jgi:hypothetical protein
VATNKTWTVTEGGGMFYAPYIPLFITKKEKVPMLLKLRRRFLNWLQAAEVNEQDTYDVIEEPKARRRVASWNNAVNSINTAKVRTGLVAKSDHEVISSQAITFKIFPARGGMVVETYHYDERADQNTNTLNLVTEDEDLSEALARIITMEAMRVK